MSNWTPVPGKGNELRRELRCYDKPTVLATVARVGSLDGLDYAAVAVCSIAGSGTLGCKARAQTLTEAKVIADALGKYVRHLALRKINKDFRRERKHGKPVRDLLAVDVTEGGDE